MKAIRATALMNEQEKDYIYREMRAALEPFDRILSDIYAVMPHSGYIVDLANGTFEPLPPLPEWQKRIDKVIEMRNEYIKSTFPEFYEH